MGTLASDTATLNFAFGGSSTSRMWEVKVSQIPCGANYGYLTFVFIYYYDEDVKIFILGQGMVVYNITQD